MKWIKCERCSKNISSDNFWDMILVDRECQECRQAQRDGSVEQKEEPTP